MTPNTKSDLLYFKGLDYKEVLEHINSSDAIKIVLFENIIKDCCFFSYTEEKYAIVLNKHRTKAHRKEMMIYFYGKILEGYIAPIAEQMKEPLKSKIEEYNAKFTALYNK